MNGHTRTFYRALTAGLPALMLAAGIVAMNHEPDPPPQRLVTLQPAATDSFAMDFGVGRFHDLPGSSMTLLDEAPPAGFAGLMCDVDLVLTNESRHANNTMSLTIGTWDTVLEDVESEGSRTIPLGRITAGHVSTAVTLGDDGDRIRKSTSSIAGRFEFTCQLPPPETVPPSSVPPSVPPSTSTSSPPPSTTTTSSVPPSTQPPSTSPRIGHDSTCLPVEGGPDRIEVRVTITNDEPGRTYYVEWDGLAGGFGEDGRPVGRWERSFDARQPDSRVVLRVRSFIGDGFDERVEYETLIDMSPCSDESEEYEPPVIVTTTTVPTDGPNRDLYQGTESG